MTEPTFIDSSAWISYTVEPDSNHAKAAKTFQLLAKSRLCTSFFIVNETISKIRKILGQERADLLYKRFIHLERRKELIIYEITRHDVEAAITILNKYPTPNTFSLTDATNIILAQKHKIPRLFSFDSDFRKLKIPHLLILP